MNGRIQTLARLSRWLVFVYLICPLSFMVFDIRAQVLLPVGDTPQQHSQWCWVGVAHSVLTVYSPVKEQCTLAEWARTQNPSRLGHEDCCSIPNDFASESACNTWNWNWGYPGSIKEILEAYGIENRGRKSPLTFKEIIERIDAQCPFIARWEWSSIDGHFVVGHGYRNDEDETVYFWNPWPGEGYQISTYQWLANNPEEGHAWTHTNIINTPISDASKPLDSIFDTDISYDSLDTQYIDTIYSVNDTFTNIDTDKIFSTDALFSSDTDYDTLTNNDYDTTNAEQASYSQDMTVEKDTSLYSGIDTYTHSFLEITTLDRNNDTITDISEESRVNDPNETDCSCTVLGRPLLASYWGLVALLAPLPE